MTLYDVEIVKAPNNPKAIKLISVISGIGERDLKEKLRQLPLTVKHTIPLFEAVAIERQLNLLGVQTKLLRVEVESEPPRETQVPIVEDPVPQPVEEVIVIPEDEIKVLPSFINHDEKRSFTVERKKISAGSRSFNIALLLGSAVILGLICWYIIVITSRKGNESEVKNSISLWQTTLQKQELLLDGGFPPERILYKINEIESKVNQLIQLIRSQSRAAELRAEFSRVQIKSETLVKDAVFRKTLEENGYPIHPSCLLDRGMVRGSSDLPESTLMRIQLFRQNDLESLHYAARISEGAFRLILDPSIEHNVYDARATVAAYSQQPAEVQKWSERKFGLSELCKQYLPNLRSTGLESNGSSRTSGGIPQIPKQEPISSTRMRNREVSLADPGNDHTRGESVEKALQDWTATMLSAQEKKLSPESPDLEQIYRRLIDLEMRIDQLISLFESSVQQNIWIEKREDVYGSFIDLRQEIDQLHGIQTRKDNPLKLEESLQQNLRNKGYLKAEVIVIDATNSSGGFNLEMMIDRGNRDDAFVSVAQALREELTGINLSIDHISMKHDGKTYGWTMAEFRKGIEALNYPDGSRRCAAELYLSSGN